jgi:hypothetical protein
MASRKYCIHNKTGDKSISSGVNVINATLEPLAILKVLIEGLAANQTTGIWLTNMVGIPMVPRISPFDLVYLDKDHRVVKGVELLPSSEFPPFKKPSVSALVLPLKTYVSTKTKQGDQFIFTEIEDESIAEIDEETVQPKKSADGKPGDETLPAAVMEVAESPAETFPVNGKAHSIEPGASEGEEQVEFEEASVPAVPRKRWVLENNHRKPERTDEPPALEFPSANHSRSEETKEPPEPQPEPEFVPAGSVEEVENSPIFPEPVSATRSIPRFAISTKQEMEESTAKGRHGAVTRFLRWLYPAVYETDRRIGIRIPIPDLVAYDVSSGMPRAFEVNNVSSSGLFLITEERWPAGSLVSLSMQREGPHESHIDHQVQFDAETVRWGANGVGLAFVLPAGMDLRLWEGQTTRAGTRRTSPEYVLREFKMARALAFLGRISPPAHAEAKRLFHEELSNVRAKYAVNVILNAEERMAQERDSENLFAHPELVIAIVNGASWADTEWMQSLWTGLLITSCTHDGQDDSNRFFINLLSQLATIQTRILTAVCAKAVTTVSSNGKVVAEKMFSSSEEMIKMAGSHDLLKVHRSVAQLAEFGLLEKSVRASFVSETEGATTTPTSLGLKMYARCLGRRENI